MCDVAHLQSGVMVSFSGVVAGVDVGAMGGGGGSERGIRRGRVPRERTTFCRYAAPLEATLDACK